MSGLYLDSTRATECIAGGQEGVKEPGASEYPYSPSNNEHRGALMEFPKPLLVTGRSVASIK